MAFLLAALTVLEGLVGFAGLLHEGERRAPCIGVFLCVGYSTSTEAVFVFWFCVGSFGGLCVEEWVSLVWVLDILLFQGGSEWFLASSSR